MRPLFYKEIQTMSAYFFLPHTSLVQTTSAAAPCFVIEYQCVPVFIRK